jgi:hypothetical protein
MTKVQGAESYKEKETHEKLKVIDDGKEDPKRCILVGKHVF